MSTADELWLNIVRAEAEYQQAIQAFHGASEKEMALNNALRTPSHRRAALRFIDAYVRPAGLEPLLEALVECVMFGHPTIAEAREILAKVNREYLLSHIEDIALKTIERDWKGPDEYEPYRRVAEFLTMIQAAEHLARWVERASKHPSEDVREVAEDFAARS